MTTATARSTMPTLRVRKTMCVGSAAPQTSTFWEGSDIGALSTAYPPSEILFADPLGHSEIENGHIRTDYTFERLVDGQWQEIDDPRVRLTPRTATERAILAENMRDFPGDYDHGDTDDDLYGQDPYDEYDQEEQVDCLNCEDRGCQLCDPSLQEEEDPEPLQVICIHCKEESDTDSDLCTDCEIELQRLCPNCSTHHGDTNLQADELCSDCEQYLASRRYLMSLWLDRVKRKFNGFLKRK